MSLAELSIRNVRCIEEARLELPRGLTLIWGGNGSGKTSVLESIFMLGRGRSFRTRNNSRLISRHKTFSRVIGKIETQAGLPVSLGIEVVAERTRRGSPAETLSPWPSSPNRSPCR